jgi:hypothetical protein
MRTSSMAALFRSLCLLIGIASLTACGSVQTVQAWEKGTLARQEMTFEGGDPLEGKFVEHIYSSKEAASKGAGVGGGGCGCN